MIGETVSEIFDQYPRGSSGHPHLPAPLWLPGMGPSTRPLPERGSPRASPVPPCLPISCPPNTAIRVDRAGTASDRYSRTGGRRLLVAEPSQARLVRSAAQPAGCESAPRRRFGPQATDSPIAAEALRRIAEHYAMEATSMTERIHRRTRDPAHSGASNHLFAGSDRRAGQRSFRHDHKDVNPSPTSRTSSRNDRAASTNSRRIRSQQLAKPETWSEWTFTVKTEDILNRRMDHGFLIAGCL
jgi:hypothetical protein